MTASLLTLLVEVCTRGSAFFLLVCIAALLLRKRDPALRHMLWFVSLLCFIIVPAVFYVVPKLSIPLPSIRIVGIDAASTALGGAAQTGVLEQITGGTMIPSLKEGVSQPGQGLPIFVSIVWFLGALVLAGRSLLARVCLARVMHGATRIEGLAGKEIQALVEKLLPRKRIIVYKSDNCRGPIVFGIRKPIILIPEKITKVVSRRLRMILAHELAHVRRRDVLTGRIAYMICCIFWFIPFVWIAYERQRVEQEKACDLIAARFGGMKTDYAEMLVQMYREAAPEPFALSFFTARVGGRNALSERVKNILSTRLRRSSMKKPAFALCICGALAGIVALTAIRSIPAFAEDKKPIAKIELVKSDRSIIVFEGEGITALDIPTLWPLGGVNHGIITTRYGLTIDPFTRLEYFHNGIDIAWALGTSVVATAKGTVIELGSDELRGEYVTLAHASGLQTHYSHLMTNVPVAVGNSVDAGQIIGYLGGTGRSTGPHIQYDISRGSEYLDPMDFVDAKVK
jgi:bla regulator protein BlaR1